MRGHFRRNSFITSTKVAQIVLIGFDARLFVPHKIETLQTVFEVGSC